MSVDEGGTGYIAIYPNFGLRNITVFHSSYMALWDLVGTMIQFFSDVLDEIQCKSSDFEAKILPQCSAAEKRQYIPVVLCVIFHCFV